MVSLLKGKKKTLENLLCFNLCFNENVHLYNTTKYFGAKTKMHTTLSLQNMNASFLSQCFVFFLDSYLCGSAALWGVFCGGAFNDFCSLSVTKC